MKKIIVTVFLLSSALFADATVYFGGGGGLLTERFSATGIDEKADAGFYRIKAGFGFRDGYAVEVAVNYAEYDKNIFSDNDGANIFFDINFVKAFDFGVGFYPNIKAGFSAGYMDVDRNIESTLGNGGFQIGGGMFIPLVGKMELELELLYRAKSWERVTLVADDVEMDSTSIEPYIGLNYRF